MLLKMNLVNGPKIKLRISHNFSEFFLYSACLSGSALAITGRGLRRRKPSWRKSRWHCLTPRAMPNLFSIN